jgi:hypothetical protein
MGKSQHRRGALMVGFTVELGVVESDSPREIRTSYTCCVRGSVGRCGSDHQESRVRCQRELPWVCSVRKERHRGAYYGTNFTIIAASSFLNNGRCKGTSRPPLGS